MNLQIPRSLDAPPRCFFWDFDVALVFLLCIGLGIVTGFTMSFAVAGIFAAAGFSRLRSGQHPGYLLHLMYWYLPVSVGFKRTPPSHERHFTG
jgi:conjugal transfer pilus assembly protein TraL